MLPPPPSPAPFLGKLQLFTRAYLFLSPPVPLPRPCHLIQSTQHDSIPYLLSPPSPIPPSPSPSSSPPHSATYPTLSSHILHYLPPPSSLPSSLSPLISTYHFTMYLRLDLDNIYMKHYNKLNAFFAEAFTIIALGTLTAAFFILTIWIHDNCPQCFFE